MVGIVPSRAKNKFLMPALVLAVLVAVFATNITVSMLASSPQAIPEPSTAVLPTSAITVSSPAFAEEHAWTLSDIAITRPGQVSALADGIRISYVLHGNVQATSSTIVKEGSFQLIVSAFQPSHDMPGQQAGRWYIRGDWTITDAQAPPPARGQRHRQGVIAGMLVSDMDEDPFASPHTLALPLQLPMTLTEAGWVRGRGTLDLTDTGGDGSVALSLSRRAAVIRSPGGEP
jgi:hypothetical protein